MSRRRIALAVASHDGDDQRRSFERPRLRRSRQFRRVDDERFRVREQEFCGTIRRPARQPDAPCGVDHAFETHCSVISSTPHPERTMRRLRAYQFAIRISTDETANGTTHVALRRGGGPSPSSSGRVAPGFRRFRDPKLSEFRRRHEKPAADGFSRSRRRIRRRCAPRG